MTRFSAARAATACIVQARMGSSRLPGKVLMRLGGETVLSHVLRRCAAIPGVDVVVCATVDESGCDAVAEEAERVGAVVFRGDETDVLSRHLGAARRVEAGVVMRVTSDCPLIDPGLCGAVLWAREESGADYAANNVTHGWPHGLDAECCTRAALELCASRATDAFDREHVTPWLRRDPNVKREQVDGPGGEPAGWRWTLDWPEDLAFLQALAEQLDLAALPDWTEVASVVRAHPELAAINAGRAAR